MNCKMLPENARRSIRNLRLFWHLRGGGDYTHSFLRQAQHDKVKRKSLLAPSAAPPGQGSGGVNPFDQPSQDDHNKGRGGVDIGAVVGGMDANGVQSPQLASDFAECIHRYKGPRWSTAPCLALLDRIKTPLGHKLFVLNALMCSDDLLP